MSAVNLGNLAQQESWEALRQSAGSWESFQGYLKSWSGALRQLHNIDAEVSRSLLGKLGLTLQDSVILTVASLCLILVAIHYITPKNKLLRLTGPQVPSFLLAILLTNLHILPGPSFPAYRTLFSVLLPVSLGLILLAIDLRSVVRSLGVKPFALSLISCFGTFLGAFTLPILLSTTPENIKAMAIVVGNGTGGTENSMAVAHALQLDAGMTSATLALLMIPYTAVCLWNFAVAGSKPLQEKLNGWLKPTMIAESDLVIADENSGGTKLNATLLLGALGVAMILIPVSDLIRRYIPPVPLPMGGNLNIPMMIILTSLALILGAYSKTIKKIPHMNTIGMALLWLAVMANFCSSDLEKAKAAVYLLIPIFVCYFINVAFTFLGAKLLRMDALSAAIASMAAVGGAASAPMVPMIAGQAQLVPLSILMSMVGYAVGNYMGWGYGQLLLRLLHGISI